MVTIKIDGKTLGREFQNMAQALAFAYQNGNCYGAEVVELALEGKSTATSSGFKQADIDAACEKYANKVHKQLISQVEALYTELEAKEAEITELKVQLAGKDTEAPQDDQDVSGDEPTITE